MVLLDGNEPANHILSESQEAGVTEIFGTTGRNRPPKCTLAVTSDSQTAA